MERLRQPGLVFRATGDVVLANAAAQARFGLCARGGAIGTVFDGDPEATLQRMTGAANGPPVSLDLTAPGAGPIRALIQIDGPLPESEDQFLAIEVATDTPRPVSVREAPALAGPRGPFDLERFNLAAAHDLRSPVHTIRMMLEVLKEDHGATLDAEALGCIDSAHAATDVLVRTVKDIAEFGRVLAIELNLGRVDLDAMVADVLGALAPRLDAVGATIAVAPLGSAHADQRLLRQALTLLLDALLGAADPSSAVRIEVLRPRHSLTIGASGLAVDAASLSRIFEPFQGLRSDGADGGATLAICRAIFARHGWDIRAEAQTEAGVRFHVLGL